MKVLNLQCAQQHGFEGWFGSEDDFQSQLARDLVACPLCSSTVIHKLPSAPRLNLLGATSRHATPDQASESASAAGVATVPNDVPKREDANALTSMPGPSPSQSAQAAFLSAVQQVLQNTEDVGDRFAEEARRIHYGETGGRPIRGQTSAREAVELIEEGIDVMPLPLPAALKHTLQ